MSKYQNIKIFSQKAKLQIGQNKLLPKIFKNIVAWRYVRNCWNVLLNRIARDKSNRV